MDRQTTNRARAPNRQLPKAFLDIISAPLLALSFFHHALVPSASSYAELLEWMCLVDRDFPILNRPWSQLLYPTFPGVK
jgi:hypothetical protein